MAITAREVNANNGTFTNIGRDLVHHARIAHVENYYVGGPAASSSSGRLPPAAAFNDAPVDRLSRHFKGGEAEIAQIADAFGRPRSNIPLRCVLFGDPGVGKSQLAYKWSKSTFDTGQNVYVVWMSATTIEKLDQGFSKILHLINHQDRDRSEQTVRLTAARRWLEEIDSGNWLLVLDNVFPDVLKFLQEHLPRNNGRGSILFTTRTKELADELANAAGERHESIRVPMPSIQDGVELFLEHFRDSELDIPSDTAQRIVRSVGCVPLVISHAAAYIKHCGSPVDELLALFEGKEKISAIIWSNPTSKYEHNSVAAAFENQLEDLERKCPHVSNLLKVLACFDPRNIPLDMLVDGATSVLKSQETPSSHSLSPVPKKPPSIVWKIKNKVLRRGDSKGKGPVSERLKLDSLLAMVQSPIELRKAIAELQTRCLTSYHDSTRTTLRIHDPIQLVVLGKMGTSTTEHRRWFECAVELACNAFEQIEDHGSPARQPECERLIPHIKSLTIQQEIFGMAKGKLLVARSHYGWYLRSQGQFGEAEELLTQVLNDQERLFGSEDVQILPTMHRLAMVYREQNRHSDAETLFNRVSCIRSRNPRS